MDVDKKRGSTTSNNKTYFQDDGIKKLYDTSIEIVRKNDDSLIVY